MNTIENNLNRSRYLWIGIMLSIYFFLTLNYNFDYVSADAVRTACIFGAGYSIFFIYLLYLWHKMDKVSNDTRKGLFPWLYTLLVSNIWIISFTAFDAMQQYSIAIVITKILLTLNIILLVFAAAGNFETEK